MIQRVFVLQRNFYLDSTEKNWLTRQNLRLPRSLLKEFKFLACGRHCSVDTELIDRKNNAMNCINCICISTEVYGHFPFSFTFVSWCAVKCIDSFPRPLLFWADPWTMESLHGKLGCPFSANSNSISSAILSQAPCGLFSAEHHFFSELGPINDHCPIPNFLASTLTIPTFAKHSSLLLFLS